MNGWRTEQQARAWPTRAPAKSRGLEWIRSHKSEEDEAGETGRGQARRGLVSAGGDFELHSHPAPAKQSQTCPEGGSPASHFINRKLRLAVHIFRKLPVICDVDGP